MVNETAASLPSNLMLSLSMQAFAIPGSLMLSVLAGALFKLRVGLVVVLLCASVGSLCCYTISFYLGHPIVEKYLKVRIAKLEVQVSKPKENMRRRLLISYRRDKKTKVRLLILQD